MLGQNGSGKSTLVRLLSTLLLPDGGSARVFGHDVVREERAVRRLVNRVSVEASFFKRMSATENLSYAARFYGLGPGVTRRADPGDPRARRLPGRPRVAPMEDLSRGMQQKVALARALLTSPVLLLLDEPTTGLDPRAKLEVQAFIREVRRLHDTTTLLCTHDMVEAETLADRVGILDGGRLLALEDPRGAAAPVPRRDARGRVHGRDRQDVRRRARRGGGVMRAAAASGCRRSRSRGVVERNAYLVKRYGWWELAFFVWTVANTLTIVFIADGVEAAGGQLDVERQTTILLIGAVIWSYLGIIFEILTETVAWERWEGTIEYTFMAPLSRAVHLLGMAAFAVIYGVIRTAAAVRRRRAVLRARVPAGRLRRRARAAGRRLGVVRRHRHGHRRAAADLAREGRPARLHRPGHAARRLRRLLPGRGDAAVDAVAGHVSPATYALEGIRAAVLDGAGLGELGDELWPLALLGAISIPAGLAVFRAGERYAKRHGKLKRSG